MAAKRDFTLVFPENGLETTTEFGRLPPGMTADAENVRAYETLQERKRGGSRPGLSKLIPPQVNGDFPIQHLNIIVDPTTPALAAEADAGGSGVPDTSTNNLRLRNPGRTVRSGGSGRPTNRNIGDSIPPAEFELADYTADQSVNGDGSPLTVTLNEAVAAGSLLIALVVIDNVGAAQAAPTVENGNGDAYSLQDTVSFTYVDAGTDSHSVVHRLYRLDAAGIADDMDIVVTPEGPDAVIYATLLRITGHDLTVPIGPIVQDSLNSTGTGQAELTSLVVGPVTVDTNPALVFMAVAIDSSEGLGSPIFDADDGYTVLIGNSLFISSYALTMKEVSSGQTPSISSIETTGAGSIRAYGSFAFSIRS